MSKQSTIIYTAHENSNKSEYCLGKVAVTNVENVKLIKNRQHTVKKMNSARFNRRKFSRLI